MKPLPPVTQGDHQANPHQVGQTEELEGTVVKVIFKSEDYHVLSVRLGRKEDIVAVGHFASVSQDDQLKLVGSWKSHNKFGLQFAVENYQLVLPSSGKGIKAFLGGGMIKGIGAKTAEKIVSFFGPQTLEIIRDNPERLIEVPGIGRDKAEKVKASLEEYRATEKIMVALQGYGVSSAYALKIYRHFGDDAVKVMQQRPYDLTDVSGIGFLIADKIASNMGIERNDPMRLSSGLLYVLEQGAQKGHVCLPEQQLLKDAVEILECNPDVAGETIERLYLQSVNRPVECRIVDDHNFYYLPYLYACERGLATRVIRISESAERKTRMNITRLVAQAEKSFGIELATEQRKAIETAIKNGVTVITGGPGTGKTTIIKAIVELCEMLDKKVLLAAPTGRAAKRMSEATGRPAKTIHRLLEYSQSTGSMGGFKRNDENPLNGDVVIIDEASMLDVVLAYQLLRAVPLGASVVLVGDIDQLPSVGPGRVLHDIIESGIVPTVRLSKIFRQAQESLIVVNAHRINTGRMPLEKHPDGHSPDFYIFEENDPAKVRDMIVDIVTRRLPTKYGVKPVSDIQVLSPMHKGPIGVQALNEALQTTLNPPMPGIKPEMKYMGQIFRIGDKVMQIRNNYDKDVYNGEVGIITDINTEDRILSAAYEQGVIPYDQSELDQLVPAYCCSIHKSQGSEYPIVVIPVHTQHFVMLQRNLVYTGLTRAKSLAIFVGSKRALALAVKNDSVPERHTHLRGLLTGEIPRDVGLEVQEDGARQDFEDPITQQLYAAFRGRKDVLAAYRYDTSTEEDPSPHLVEVMVLTGETDPNRVMKQMAHIKVDLMELLGMAPKEVSVAPMDVDLVEPELIHHAASTGALLKCSDQAALAAAIDGASQFFVRK